MNDDLKSFLILVKGNKISLNAAKTYFMHICSESNPRSLNAFDEKLDLKFREDSLEGGEKAKYLGVQIDQSLDWKGHIR